MASAIDGMDAVLHIAAVPDPGASFDDVLSSNIVGTHNVLEGCPQGGVRRLVYASSIMVNWLIIYDEPYKAVYGGALGQCFHQNSLLDPSLSAAPDRTLFGEQGLG